MGGKNITVQVEKHYQSHTDEPLSSNTECSTKNDSCVLQTVLLSCESKGRSTVEHGPFIVKYLWITGIMQVTVITVNSHDYSMNKVYEIPFKNQAFK